MTDPTATRDRLFWLICHNGPDPLPRRCGWIRR